MFLLTLTFLSRLPLLYFLSPWICLGHMPGDLCVWVLSLSLRLSVSSARVEGRIYNPHCLVLMTHPQLCYIWFI